jgi:acyl-CoA thioester hydrolase
MRDQYRLWVPINVRWGDMDAMGHVNNAVYFTYFEISRMKYFETVRLDDLKEAHAHGPAVVSATINFRRQIRYPAQLEAGVRVAKIGARSFTFEHHLLEQPNGNIAADGATVVAWVDYAAGKSIPLPDAVRRAFRAFEGCSID